MHVGGAREGVLGQTDEKLVIQAQWLGAARGAGAVTALPNVLASASLP
jgi:hypothetical protein